MLLLHYTLKARYNRSLLKCWKFQVRLCQMPSNSSNSSAIVRKYQTEVKKQTFYISRKWKMSIKRTERIPSVSKSKVGSTNCVWVPWLPALQDWTVPKIYSGQQKLKTSKTDSNNEAGRSWSAVKYFSKVSQSNWAINNTTIVFGRRILVIQQLLSKEQKSSSWLWFGVGFVRLLAKHRLLLLIKTSKLTIKCSV